MAGTPTRGAWLWSWFCFVLYFSCIFGISKYTYNIPDSLPHGLSACAFQAQAKDIDEEAGIGYPSLPRVASAQPAQPPCFCADLGVDQQSPTTTWRCGCWSNGRQSQIVMDPEGPRIRDRCRPMSSDVIWLFFWTVVWAGTIPKFGGQSAALLEALELLCQSQDKASTWWWQFLSPESSPHIRSDYLMTFTLDFVSR